MGVYIPNMNMPITCDDCIVPLSKCDFLQKRADDCPLIEIIPCKECIYNTDNTDGDNRGWCYKHGIDIIGFCSEGE